jgi:hypothetical protein
MLTAILSAGCGGGGSSSGGSTPAPPVGTTITGTVSKGPFTSGYVNSYKLSGTTRVPYRTATISSGSYSIDFGNFTGGVLLEAFGTYYDEATNTPVTLTVPLRAALYLPGPSGPVTVNLTPLTELAVRNAEGRTGGLTQANVTTANALVSDLFPFDIFTTRPVAPDAVTLGPANDYQKCYAMLLTGISKETTQITLNDLINSWASSLQAYGRLSADDVTNMQLYTQAFLDSGPTYNHSGYTSTNQIPYFFDIGNTTTIVTVASVKGTPSASSTANMVQFALVLSAGLTIDNTAGVPVNGVITLPLNSQSTQKEAYVITDPGTGVSVMNIALTNLSGIPVGQLAEIRVRTSPTVTPGPGSITVAHLYQNGQESSVPFASLNDNSTTVNWLIQATY